ncbi:hypothetical protein HDU81_009197, partial [Chytriomyces hyalinus]
MTTPSKSGTSVSGAGSASQRDLSEFVSYLLDGSGVENVVDLHRLRRELEDESSSYGATASLQPNNNPNYNQGKSLDSINLNAKSITLTSTPNDKKSHSNSPLEPAISPIRDLSEGASFPKANKFDSAANLKSAGPTNDPQSKMSAASGANAYLTPSMRQNIPSSSSQPPKTDKEAPKYRSQPSIAMTHPQPHFSASSAYLSRPAFQGESQTSDSGTTRFLNHTVSATTQNESRSLTFSRSEHESNRSNRINERRIPAVQATPTRDAATNESVGTNGRNGLPGNAGSDFPGGRSSSNVAGGDSRQHSVLAYGENRRETAASKGYGEQRDTQPHSVSSLYGSGQTKQWKKDQNENMSDTGGARSISATHQSKEGMYRSMDVLSRAGAEPSRSNNLNAGASLGSGRYERKQMSEDVLQRLERLEDAQEETIQGRDRKFLNLLESNSVAQKGASNQKFQSSQESLTRNILENDRRFESGNLLQSRDGGLASGDFDPILRLSVGGASVQRLPSFTESAKGWMPIDEEEEPRNRNEEHDAENDVFKGRETGRNSQRVLSRGHHGDGRKWEEEGQVVGEDLDMDESLLKIYKEYGGPDSLLGTRAESSGAPLRSNATDAEAGASRKSGRGKSDAEWNENARAMASETRVQEWISGHPGVEATDEIRELEQISSRLNRMGLPALHPSLNGVPPSSGGPEGAGIQRFHLAKILNALLDDISRRADDVQHLSDRVLENLEARKILEDRVAELELGRNDGENRDWKIIQEQQQSLDALNAQMSTLRSELVESRHDLEDTRSLNHSLKRRISEREMEQQRAEYDLEQLKTKMEKTRRQNEQTFAQMAERVSRFRTDPTKSGMDRLTLEVIEVYEAKLANLNEKINELRSRAPGADSTTAAQPAMNDTTGSYFPKAIDLDREIEALENYGLPKRHFTRQNADGETEQISVDASKKHQLQKLQEEQIRDLEQRLSKTQRDLLQATQQSELLKLQLLETKRPGWVEQSRSDITSGLSTRELIRRDKKSWKMKLYQIDAMNLEECRTLLKNVCIHLAIPDVPSLLPGLAAIDSTLRLLPQLQSFVSAIANLVNTHYTRLFEIDASPQHSAAQSQPFDRRVAKLDEMIRVVELWARGSDDIESLRDFRREIHRMLGVREGSGSLGGCREVVTRLKERRESGITGDKSASDYKELDVLRRFKWEIFDIIGLDEGVSGLQEALEMVRSFSGDGNFLRRSDYPADLMEKLRALEEFADNVHGALSVEKGHQSFKQCLDAIASIASNEHGVHDDGGDVPTSAQCLQMFVTSVHKLLRIIEKPGSLQDCLETIRQQIEQGSGTSAQELSMHEASVRIVQHFMELFEIHNISEVSSAINELYVTYAERNAGIARLRSSLRNSIPVRESLDTPGRVLNKAADVIDSIFDKSQHMIGIETVDKSTDQGQVIGDMSLNMFEDDMLLEAVESATHRQDPQF